MVADIAFMLDGSGSVNRYNFNKVKNFVEKVVFELNVGADPIKNSRVSVTVFSNSVYPQFNFGKHSTTSDYIRAIKSIQYTGGG